MQKILNISEAASLAVHSMALIAHSENTLNASQLAMVTQSSKNHLAKVMQVLVKKRLLNSTRGPKGGFVLNRPARDLNLLTIYEAIEGPLTQHHCGIHDGRCPFKTCVFNNLHEKISSEFIQYLKEKKLSEIEVNPLSL